MKLGHNGSDVVDFVPVQDHLVLTLLQRAIKQLGFYRQQIKVLQGKVILLYTVGRKGTHTIGKDMSCSEEGSQMVLFMSTTLTAGLHHVCCSLVESDPIVKVH